MGRVIPMLVLTSALCACATALTPGGAGVRLMKSDPPAGCKEIGDVSGYGGGAGALENAKNEMRNKASDRGANYVRVETADIRSSQMTGTAYQCPESTLPPAN